MRKKICLLIFLVLLLLGALLFTDGSYRPFVKLTAQDIASVTIQLGDEEARCLHSGGSLREAVRVLQQISILFSASPEDEALARVEIEFISGQHAQLTLYAYCLSIDGKSYSLSRLASEELLSGLAEIR